MTTRIAILFDKFLLNPGDLASLTDWQIEQIYFHPRNKDGSIKIPDGEAPDREDTEEEALRGLLIFRSGMLEADYQAGVAKIKEKFRIKRLGLSEGTVIHGEPTIRQDS